MQGLERARKKPPAQEQWLAMKRTMASNEKTMRGAIANNEKSERDICGSRHAIGAGRRKPSLKSFDFLGSICQTGPAVLGSLRTAEGGH
jgi:hypothetical protein